MKKYKWLILVGIAAWVSALTCGVLCLSHAVTLEIKSVAVDSKGAIYVGKYEKIDVYQEGELVRSFSPKTSKAYVFIIDDSDLLHLYTGTKSYLMDCNGRILSETEEGAYEMFSQYYGGRNRFVASDGVEYRIRGQLLWPGIVAENKTVYRVSALSFAVKMVLYMDGAALVGIVIWFAVNEERNRRGASAR